MKNNFTLFAAIIVVMSGTIAGCTPAEKKEQDDKQAHASKYQDMAAQRGMTRPGAPGGTDAAAPSGK
jgi:outer membrane murein-binding lipoprotein Lpp